MSQQPGGPDRGRIVLHADMDAFFASVALRDHPELRGRPMIVGGAVRGVVLSATYEARAYGVSSGMPMARATRLCPDAVVIPPQHDQYREVSAAVFAIFDSFTDTVEAASVDEAFLDITGARRRLGPPRRIGEQIRARVAEEQHITCSVGIAPTKFVAKLASTSVKPNGLAEVPPGSVIGFLHPLPVERMWGVGKVTTGKLHHYGIRTIGDLAHTPVDTLVAGLGEAQGRNLHELAWGRDPRPVVSHEPERSIGSEETFAEDLTDPAAIERELLRMADRTSARLRKAGLVGKTVTITVRSSDFSTITRSAALPTPTDVTSEIHAQAVTLFRRLGPLQAAVRLVGVRLEGLRSAAATEWQPTLDEPEHGWREAEDAVDQAIAKFGPGAVRRAALQTPRER